MNTSGQHGKDETGADSSPSEPVDGAARPDSPHESVQAATLGQSVCHRRRSSPWNRPRDRAAAAAIALLSVIAMVLVWAFGDSRATSQQTAPAPAPLPSAPSAVPATLTEIWRAPSDAAPVPVAPDNLVITGDGGQVAGRDPLTGEVQWHYTRDLSLCTVVSAWSTVLAVYRKDSGCSEVTQLDPGTGQRTAQRNGDAELGTRLVTDGGYVTTTGDRLLNTWRNDLVKSMEYGQVPAPVQPEVQPRTGCTYGTVAAADDAVGVIENCPRESGARLTVLKAAGDEADEPEQEFSALLPEESATLVTMSADAVAVALPEHRQLRVYDRKGQQIATYPLDVPTAELADTPRAGIVPVTSSGMNIYWFTGSRTIALSGDDLAPQWAFEDTRGPGARFAGHYVVPTENGLAVLDERTGTTIRTVDVDRHGHRGEVQILAAGPVLLEQRGDTVVALN